MDWLEWPSALLDDFDGFIFPLFPMCTGPPDISLLLNYVTGRLHSLSRNVQRLVGGVGAISRAEATCFYPPHSQIHGQQQGVDITIPVTCSVFEPDPMTSQCTMGAPQLKFRHKIHEMWVIFSSVAIASQ